MIQDDRQPTAELPSTALTTLIDFTYQGLNTPYAQSPIVYLPFPSVPIDTEVKAVAEHFANFVAQQTGKPTIYEQGRIRPLATREPGMRYDCYHVTPRSRDSLFNYVLRRQGLLTNGQDDPQGEVVIRGEEYSGVDTALILEAYVRAMKTQPK